MHWEKVQFPFTRIPITYMYSPKVLTSVFDSRVGPSRTVSVQGFKKLRTNLEKKDLLNR